MKPEQRIGIPNQSEIKKGLDPELKRVDSDARIARGNVALSDRIIAKLEEERSQGKDVSSNLAAAFKVREQRANKLAEAEQKLAIAKHRERVREDIKQSGLPEIAENEPLTIPESIGPGTGIEGTNAMLTEINLKEKDVQGVIGQISGLMRERDDAERKGDRFLMRQKGDEIERLMEGTLPSRMAIRNMTMQIEMSTEKYNGGTEIQSGTQKDIEKRLLNIDEEIAEAEKKLENFKGDTEMTDPTRRINSLKRTRNHLLGWPENFTGRM